ncbi:MAG: acyl-CoA thioesterase [Nitrosomonas sp.]|nr:acyl-CoA thioesterase [Nitrosomonas sp.]
MNKMKASQSDLLNGSVYSEKQPAYNRTIHVYETDKDGVVHFSNYFKIAEEALYSGLRQLGFAFECSEYSMAMINTSADYIHPIKFAEQLDIVISEIKVKRVKLVFSIDFKNSQQVSLAKVQLTFVLIDPKDRKAIPVPEQLKLSLSQLRNINPTTNGN